MTMALFSEYIFVASLSTLITNALSSEYGFFNIDETTFQLKWPGQTISMESDLISEEIIMKTLDNEQYRCLLPSNNEGREEQRIKNYHGPTAEELMEPLYKQLSCSYRIESYWNYELCHGKHVRQYHEEKESGQNIKLQEFYLGKFTKHKKTEEKDPEKNTEIPTKKIDGHDLPYYEVEMDDGTLCDLANNTPRKSKILYICEPTSKQEIYSFEEISTCEYELVVLTPNLCSNPSFKPKEVPVSEINCQPLAGSPMKPKGLRQLESEGNKAQYSSQTTQRHVLKPEQKKPLPVPKEEPVAEFTDTQLIRDFLNGDYCLHGGQGWWKYEFCYGKFAQQYHVEKTGRTTINLGYWNEKEHREWFKKVKKTRGLKSVYLYYGHGDICDMTGKPRNVQVKLKCKESKSPNAVSIYLVEPATCEYILGVESPLICKLLDTADEDGVLHPVLE
ncbi:endoplasmic reticulum lectin 1-like [Saccoglossus kowalevskii]|uniref:Endoplasmic reticulum lectin 1 n=1 Tax=Saccoglossus kowalevskii TaxID=10224 RepID=A0ABM0N0H7_SACKO|nr:PREDICTED: endoplasmic reticulum lectin 1-like [Saccoglossus kowalevskii]